MDPTNEELLSLFDEEVDEGSDGSVESVFEHDISSNIFVTELLHHDAEEDPAEEIIRALSEEVQQTLF